MSYATLQRKLAAAGYDPGPLDGRWGARTAAALDAALRDARAGRGPAPAPAEAPVSTLSLPLLRGHDKLVGVHPDLVAVVERAHAQAPGTFRVLEGLRTRARQAELMAEGKSRTMDSRHLTGHAVDLYPLTDIDGDKAVGWDDWDEFYGLAYAMKAAAEHLNVPVRWGGYWGILNGGRSTLRSRVETYGRERRAAGRRAFLDGPHFELPRDRYPVTGRQGD